MAELFNSETMKLSIFNFFDQAIFMKLHKNAKETWILCSYVNYNQSYREKSARRLWLYDTRELRVRVFLQLSTLITA